jgi:hypothetical protein
MAKYLVKDQQGNLVKIGAVGFTPPDSILIPKDLEEEDQAWLKVEDITDPETGEIQRVVTVDEELKAQVLAERAQAEAERLAAETVRKQAQDARLTRIRSADLDRADINQLRAVVKDIVEHLNLKGEANGT